MKWKKKVTSVVSAFLALAVMTSSSGYEDDKNKDDDCILDSTSQSVDVDDEDISSEPSMTVRASESVEKVEEYVTYEPVETEVDVQPVESSATYEVDRVDDSIDNMGYSERCAMIDKMNVEGTLKNLLYKMSEHLDSCACRDTFLRLIDARKDEIPELLVRFVDESYSGIFTNIHSSGEEVVYPADKIVVFDNRDGAVDLPKCVYLLDDPSIFGGYSVFREIIAPHGGIIGYNVIVTDRDNRIVLTMRELYGEASYSVVGANLHVTKLEDYLNSVGLAFVMKDNYQYADLYELGFDLSKKVGDYTADDGIYSAEDILVLEVPKTTGSWFISNKGNDSPYYFLVKQGPYLFKENTVVCKSLFHEDAFVTYDSTGLYGLVYHDYIEHIAINCDNDSTYFESIVSLDEFMKNKGYESFEGGVCDKKELAVLYGELCKASLPEADKAMKMKPKSDK